MTRTPAPALSAEEAAEVARFGMFDDENRAAAKALRDAADACEAHGNTWRQMLAGNSAPFGYARWLRKRAAALDTP